MRYLLLAMICIAFTAGYAQVSFPDPQSYLDFIDQKLDERNQLHNQFMDALQNKKFDLAQRKSNSIAEFVPAWHAELKATKPYLGEAHFLPAVQRLADYDLNSHKAVYPRLIQLMKHPLPENVKKANEILDDYEKTFNKFYNAANAAIPQFQNHVKQEVFCQGMKTAMASFSRNFSNMKGAPRDNAEHIFNLKYTFPYSYDNWLIEQGDAICAQFFFYGGTDYAEAQKQFEELRRFLKQCSPQGYLPEERQLPQQELSQNNRSFSGFIDKVAGRHVRAELYHDGQYYYVGLNFIAK